MKHTTWYVRRYICDNGVEYKTKFPVKEDLTEGKNRKKKHKAMERAEKSACEASHEVGRLLNCNFKVGQDYYIGLDYSDAGIEKLQNRSGDELLILSAKKEFENFMRRVKRKAAQCGVEVKAIAVISVSNPKTGEAVRVHHHVVCNAEALPFFTENWKVGAVWSKRLRSAHGVDLQELANYMIAQAARVGADKRYTHTRNLVRAIVCRPVKAKRPEAELIVPRGCVELWRGEYVKGLPQHIRYYRPPAAQREEEKSA